MTENSQPSEEKVINLNDVKEFGQKTTQVNRYEEKRQNFKTYSSGVLASFLWLTFAGVIFWHITSVSDLNKYLLQNSSSQPQNIPSQSIEVVEKQIDKGIAAIESTAKTIYTLLGPLLVASTTFYFGSINSVNGNNN
jgi:hypothetical protein